MQTNVPEIRTYFPEHLFDFDLTGEQLFDIMQLQTNVRISLTIIDKYSGRCIAMNTVYLREDTSQEEIPAFPFAVVCEPVKFAKRVLSDLHNHNIFSVSQVCSECLQSLRLWIAGILIRHPKLTLYSVAMLCVLTVVSIFFLHTSSVNAQSDHINSKYFTVIEVEAGDTLWEIAQEYRTSEYYSLQDYIKEVREINHISGDEITSGCYLTIPYYAEEPLTAE